jgi:hypothetical protein
LLALIEQQKVEMSVKLNEPTTKWEANCKCKKWEIKCPALENALIEVAHWTTQ